MVVRVFALLLMRMFESHFREASPFAAESLRHGASDASASSSGRRLCWRLILEQGEAPGGGGFLVPLQGRSGQACLGL